MGDSDLAELLRLKGIRDERVLGAIASLDRRDFVPEFVSSSAGEDVPLPIGHAQTISQPYVVALMTSALELKPADRVLEVGTGSGYQTAVLARLAREVYSVEIVPELAEAASRRLEGLKNVHLRTGDGHRGWPEAAPFDAILLTAAPARIPDALLAQLAVGGRMVAPVGPEGGDQDLVLLTRTPDDIEVKKLIGVRFVPMTHREAPN